MQYPTSRSPKSDTKALAVVHQPAAQAPAVAVGGVRPVVPSASAPQALEMRLKRLLDLIGAFTGLVLLGPLMTAITILIGVDSPGPALFKQRRFGRGGSPFTFYKFRTMFDGNDPKLHREFVSKLINGEAQEGLRGANGSLKIENDPRVTRLGRVLRRTSLDELPQLINVLKGDMSLVGPRPPVHYEIEMYQPEHLRRLDVLPGMTGLWQVSGRTQTGFDEMVALDQEYIETWSLWLDVKILWRTIFVVLSRKGAW